MTKTLKSSDLTLPSLYSWRCNDFVKADLEEHCRFVRTAAETESDLTEMIFTSPAPLLIRVAAFENFVVSRYTKDGIGNWINRFITDCAYNGSTSRMVHNPGREQQLLHAHNGSDPTWNDSRYEVPFGVCVACTKTICLAVKKTVDKVLPKPASDGSFVNQIIAHPEWIDSDRWWTMTSKKWDDLKEFRGMTFRNMARVFYMLHTDRMTHWTRREDSIWRQGWLSDACNVIDTADGGSC